MRQIKSFFIIVCILQNKFVTLQSNLKAGALGIENAFSLLSLCSKITLRLLAAPRQSSNKLGSALGLHNNCHCNEETSCKPFKTCAKKPARRAGCKGSEITNFLLTDRIPCHQRSIYSSPLRGGKGGGLKSFKQL